MNDMDAILNRNGPILGQSPVPENTIAVLQEKVPQILLDIWRIQGTGSWLQGLFTICTPDQFEGLLSQVFHADQDFSHADCHIFGCTAFGIVYAWSERYGLIHIDMAQNLVIANELTTPRTEGRREDAITALLFRLSKNESLDAYDDAGKKLFSRAVKKLGRPGPGQAFGFFPALAMGGAPELKNIKIVPALEHFLFLAQLQQFQLVDYLATPPKIIRPIG